MHIFTPCGRADFTAHERYRVAEARIVLFLEVTRAAVRFGFPDEFDQRCAPLSPRGQVPGPRVEALRPSHLQTEFALGDFAAAEFSHYAAFEHYQNAVRQSEDFVQLGRDKQDAGAFVAGADDAGVNELNGAEKPAGDLRQPQVRPLAAEPAPTMVFPDPSLRSLLGPTSPCRGRTCTCKRIKIRRLQVGNGIA